MADSSEQLEESPPSQLSDGASSPKPEQQRWWRLNWDRAVPWIAILVSASIAAGSLVGAILQTNQIHQALSQEYDEKLRALRESVIEEIHILRDDTREDIREIRAHLLQNPGTPQPNDGAD